MLTAHHNVSRTNAAGLDFSSPESRVKKELEFLLMIDAMADTDILVWWKSHDTEFPLLSSAARKLFSSTATSVTSESGHIVSKKGILCDRIWSTC